MKIVQLRFYDHLFKTRNKGVLADWITRIYSPSYKVLAVGMALCICVSFGTPGTFGGFIVVISGTYVRNKFMT